jgi:hypothetical protein
MGARRPSDMKNCGTAIHESEDAVRGVQWGLRVEVVIRQISLKMQTWRTVTPRRGERRYFNQSSSGSQHVYAFGLGAFPADHFQTPGRSIVTRELQLSNQIYRSQLNSSLIAHSRLRLPCIASVRNCGIPSRRSKQKQTRKYI